MARPTTGLDFIDRGDSCESGPPSSIGEYDLNDDFIDDNVSTHSQVSLLRGRPSVRDSIETRARSTSSRLFVTPGTGRIQKASRSSRRSSGDSTRVRRRLAELFSRNSSLSQSVSRSRASSRNSIPWSESNYGSPGDPILISESDGESTGSSEPQSPAKTPDPFQFPEHLDSTVRNNTSLPGKRLGSGRPRWSGRYIMLTYSQTGKSWPYQQLVAMLDSLGAKYRIGRERHADGGFHFHAFVNFERKYDFEDVHKFCVGQKRSSRTNCPGQTHCNILRVYKTPENTWDYVGKSCPPPDGPPLQAGETLESRTGELVASNCERPTPRKGGSSRDENWAHSLSLPTGKEFSEDVEKHSPRDYVVHHNAIQKIAESKDYIKPLPKEPSVEGLIVHWSRFPTIKRWVLDSLPNGIEIISRLAEAGSYSEQDREGDQNYLNSRTSLRGERIKSLILVGDTKLGKTDFATNLGKHIHFHYDFHLKALLEMGSENLEYVIFDDVSWHNNALKQDRYKSWLGCQESFYVTDKYSKKKELHFGKPCIFSTNKSPYEAMRVEDMRWLSENCVIVDIGQKDAERTNAISSRTIFDNRTG